MIHDVVEYSFTESDTYFRTLRVASGELYNFWDRENDCYSEHWLFVPDQPKSFWYRLWH